MIIHTDAGVAAMEMQNASPGLDYVMDSLTRQSIYQNRKCGEDEGAKLLKDSIANPPLAAIESWRNK
ncbi:hypothetical protein ACHAWO_007338 [Cyclotella atomus]|uniref:Uncharacterized protein n=1 Tax=Cyclotella atomus TaxID=382360 RepID=A0ABD3PIC8_9STRA